MDSLIEIITDNLMEHHGIVPFPWYKLENKGRERNVTDVGDEFIIYQKIFIYAISPFAFGKTYEHKLFHECSQFVGITKMTAPFDVANHSAENEEQIKLLVQQVTVYLQTLINLPKNETKKMEKYSKLILKMKEPQTLINFAQEKCKELFGHLGANNKTALLFAILLVAVFNEDFQSDILDELTKYLSRQNLLEVLCLRDRAATASLSGDFVDGLKLYMKALDSNFYDQSLYFRISLGFFHLGEYLHAVWCALRAIWLCPVEIENHIMWMKSVEALGDAGAALTVANCLTDWFRIFNANAVIEPDPLHKLIEIQERLTKRDTKSEGGGDFLGNRTYDIQSFLQHLAGALPPGIFPQSPLQLNLDQRSSSGTELHDTSFNKARPLDILRQHYYFVPFDWLRVCPLSEYGMFSTEDSFGYSTLFPFVISPIAFGVNFTHPLLAKCATELKLVGKLPFDTSAQTLKREADVKKIVGYAQRFLMLSRVTAFPHDIREVLWKALRQSTTTKVLEIGKGIVKKMFGDTAEWIDDDQVVYTFMIMLMFALLTEFRDAHAGQARLLRHPNVMVMQLSEAAKAYMGKKDYDEALKLYKRALHHAPMDPVLFSNIAQVYINTQKYRCAQMSVLRSIWLSPHIPKNHYRWIKATSQLGKHTDAFSVSGAVKYCMDLVHRHGGAAICTDLLTQYEEMKQKAFAVENVTAPDNKSEVKPSCNTQSSKSSHQPKTTTETVLCDAASALPKEDASEASAEIPKSQVNPKEKKPKSKPNVDAASTKSSVATNSSKTNSDAGRPGQSQKKQKEEVVSFSSALKPAQRFQECLREGSTYLMQSVYTSSMEKYQMALEILKKEGLKALNVSDVHEVLLKYCYGKACIEKRTYKLLHKGIALFDEIITQHRVIFPLAYYGKGRALFLENKFSEAIDALEKGLKIIDKNITFEAYTYPGHQEVILESCPDKLKELLEVLLASCRIPPAANGSCNYGDCRLSRKIYMTDPDFHGFVRLHCGDQCRLEYHPSCWKEFMAESKLHGDKNILDKACATPDCSATIVKLDMIGGDGEIRKTIAAESKPKEKPKSQPKREETIKSKEPAKVAPTRTLRASSTTSNDSAPEVSTKTFAESAPDTRDSDSAIAVLKFGSERTQSPKRKVAATVNKPEPRNQHKMMIQFSDQERVDALRATKNAAESLALAPNYFRSWPLNPYAQLYQTPPREIVNDVAASEAYLCGVRHPCTLSAGGDSLTTPVTDCHDMKEDIIEFLEQYVAANGPISLSSDRFLHEVNSLPTEVQAMMSAFDNFRDFLAGSRLSFVGNVALDRRLLGKMMANSRLLCCLDLARPLGSWKSTTLGGRLQRSISVDQFVSFFRVDGHGGDNGSCKAMSDDDDRSGASSVAEEEGFFDAMGGIMSVEGQGVVDNLRDEIMRLECQLQECHNESFAVKKQLVVEKTNHSREQKELQDKLDFWLQKSQEWEVGRSALLKLLEAERKRFQTESGQLKEELEKREQACVRIAENLTGTELALVQESRRAEEEKRRRLKLEENLDDVKVALAVMEENLETVRRKNRELEDCLRSLTEGAEVVAAREEEAKKTGKMLVEETAINERLMERICALERELEEERESKTMTAAKEANSRAPLLPTPAFPPQLYPPFRFQPQLRHYGNFNNPMHQPQHFGPYSDHNMPFASWLESMMAPRPTVPPSTDNVGGTSDASANCNSLPAKAADVPQVDDSVEAVASQGVRPKTTKTKPSKVPSYASSVCSDVGSVAEVSTRSTAAATETAKGFSLSYGAKVAVKSKPPRFEKALPQNAILKMFKILSSEYENLHMSEFYYYVHVVRMAHDTSLTGVKLKDIVKRLRCEVAKQHRAKVTYVEAPAPSFWKDVVGKPPKSKVGADEECAICLNHINTVESRHVMRCDARHAFHYKCIKLWYDRGQQNCPICRKEVPLLEDFPPLYRGLQVKI